jgi:hypothetical protein
MKIQQAEQQEKHLQRGAFLLGGAKEEPGHRKDDPAREG